MLNVKGKLDTFDRTNRVFLKRGWCRSTLSLSRPQHEVRGLLRAQTGEPRDEPSARYSPVSYFHGRVLRKWTLAQARGRASQSRSWQDRGPGRCRMG